MVKINNQRKAFLDMLAWSERVDKPEIMVVTSLGGELAQLLVTLANLSAKSKTQINRRRTLPASFPLVGCLPLA